MRLKLPLVLATFAVAGAATSALADPVIAKLQAPVASAVKPVAGGAVFECLGDVCAARSPSDSTETIRGCKDLVRQVGAVTAFGAGAKALAGDRLADCNQSARK